MDSVGNIIVYFVVAIAIVFFLLQGSDDPQNT